MSDNTTLNKIAGLPGDTIATDDISGVKHQRVKVQHGADGSATDVSSAAPLPVDIRSVSSLRDAFGRLRTSDPETIFDSKQIFDNQALFWDDQEESGSGTSSTHSANAARSRLAVSATTAGKRTRQTFMRFNYQPGKSQLILMTAVMSSAGASGITASVGLFDDNDGIFFQMDGTIMYIVRRSNVTGSPVDTKIAQADVNGDSMDGTGASGVTIDPTKTQIVWIDLEWLGVGSARVGFVIDGAFILMHTFNHANEISTVYMSTPNLPLRYQIENDGTGAATSMDAICATVISEGGKQDNGIVRCASTGATEINANVIGTKYVVFGIRLKSAYIGATIKILGQSIIATTNGDYEWQLILNPTVATAITWSNETNSAVQTGPGNPTNPSDSTATGGTVLAAGFVKSDKSSGDANVDIETAIRLGAAIDGTVDEIYLVISSLGTNANVHGSILWRELL